MTTGSEEDFLADEILDVLDEAEAAPDAALREPLEHQHDLLGCVPGDHPYRDEFPTPPAEEKP